MRHRARARRLGVLGLVVGFTAIAPAPALAVPPPHLTAHAAALLEVETGHQLYGNAVDQRLAIASATKLMTALVTLEHVHRLGQTFVQNDYFPAPADSQIGLVPGERMSVHDLLVAMLLPSADDAAEDIAYNVGHRSIALFVAMMNARARQLRLTHTHYSTPIGLDTPGNYSSASDLVALARFLLMHQPFFRRVVGLHSATLKTGNRSRVVINRNDLVGRVPWINGIKTGHTLQAGYVLVGSGTRSGMTLISVVLGTDSESSRDENTLALLHYGFANFHRLEPVKAGRVMARLPVRDQPGRRARAVAATSFVDVFPRSARVRVRVQARRPIAGPLRKGARVGRVLVLADGRRVAAIPLLLARAVPAVSPATIARSFLTRPSTLVSVAVLLVGGLAGLAFWRQRVRRRPTGGAGAR